MKCLVGITLLVTVVVWSATEAQVAVVIQPVHLRADPSTSHVPLGLLLPPARLRLIPPKEEGEFYHVRTERDETGWVWKPNVNIYNRNDWMRGGRWKDADNDCQTTRHEVLVAESTIAVILNPQGCVVLSGRWEDPYGGEVLTNPSDLDIDHLVPLAHAHVSGGWAWERERREAYANDLVNPEHLIAVRDILNQQKGDKSPDQWRPPRQEFWCAYATAWLAIKKRWQLTLMADEATAIAEMMRTCP